MATIEEELAALGITPPEPQSFQGHPLLELLSGLESQPHPQPQSLGEGFLYGLTGGLGRAGTKAAAARQRFEAQQAIRQREYDQARREATRDYRRERAQALKESSTEERRAREEQAKYERDNPVVTPEMAGDNPTLKRFIGQRVPFSFLKPEKPEKTLAQIEDEATARARGGRKGAPPAGSSGTGGKPPSPTERLALVHDEQALAQTANVEKLFKPEYVGMIRGRKGALGMATGKGLAKGEEDFRAAVAIYRNAVINALSGTAVGVKEAERMRQQIPDENDPPRVFKAKLEQTRKNIKSLADIRRGTLTRTGVDLGGLSTLEDDDAAYDEYLRLSGAK